MFYFPELGYTILISTIKASILLSYHRIFGHITWVRRANYVLGGLVVGWCIAIFFSAMFQCTPIDKVWKPMKPGHCTQFIPFLWGNSITNNVIDWSILILPIIPVWKLQMEAKQKVLVIGAFGLGSL